MDWIEEFFIFLPKFLTPVGELLYGLYYIFHKIYICLAFLFSLLPKKMKYGIIVIFLLTILVGSYEKHHLNERDGPSVNWVQH